MRTIIVRLVIISTAFGLLATVAQAQDLGKVLQGKIGGAIGKGVETIDAGKSADKAYREVGRGVNRIDRPQDLAEAVSAGQRSILSDMVPRPKKTQN